MEGGKGIAGGKTDLYLPDRWIGRGRRMALTDQQKDRYSRQIILDEIGESGQEKLLESSVVIVGCGALGSVIANNLVRGGVGKVTMVDRDLVELSNLQRQMLFQELDVGKAKAVASAEKLAHINSDIEIIPMVEDVNYATIEGIITGADLVLDGTDNMETRFLINDACLKNSIPWIYGGAIGTYGMTMNIIPDSTPCLRCIVPHLPDAGSMDTCDTYGVINSIPSIIASIQSTEAMRILIGKPYSPDLLIWDIWDHSYRSMQIDRNPDCPCCGKGTYEFLEGGKREIITSLCGTNSVQITPINKEGFRFSDLVARMEKVEGAMVNKICVKLDTNQYELVIFKNGRIIVHGTKDQNVAKSLYAKYVGL